MNFAPFIPLVIKIVLWLIDKALEGGEIEEAEATAAKRSLESSRELTQKAAAARAAALERFKRTGGVPDPTDPNLRD